MGSIDAEILANQRLVVLRALAENHDGRLNESLIARALDLYGHRLSRDGVRDTIKALEERGAVEIDWAGDVIMIATLTARGEDHVERRGAPIDGIAVPSRR